MVNLAFSSNFVSEIYSSESSASKLQKRQTTAISSSAGSSLVSSVKATATQANGCVECPSVSCPDCGDNYYCVKTTLTCTQCPITYCVKKQTLPSSSTSTSHKSNKGAIAGGVVGGVIGGVLIISLIIYYFRRSKKRNAYERRSKSASTGHHSDIFDEGKSGSYYETGGNGYPDDDNEIDDLFGLDEYDNSRNRTGSNYFATTGGNTLRSSNIEKDDVLGVLPLTHDVLGKNKRKRNDETSSVSTGNASNVIPVGYIPGIKSNGLRGLKQGSKKNIPDELKSHYTLGSSILGDMNEDNVVPQTKLDTLAEEQESVSNQTPSGRYNKVPSSTGDGSESDYGVLVTPAQEVHQTALRGKVSLLKIPEGNEQPSPQKTTEPLSDDDDESIVLDIDVENH